jgi:transposase
LAKKKRTAGSGGIQLIFADECEVHTHPQLAKVWQKRGEPMKVLAAGEDHNFVVFGGVEYGTGKIIWQRSERKDSEVFIKWLDELSETYPKEMVLIVLDNVKYHKSRQCKIWWDKHQDHIRPFWLPAYTPNLNLMERVWRFLKAKLVCHRWWADLPALEIATDQILIHLEVCFGVADRPSLNLVQNFCHSA